MRLQTNIIMRLLSLGLLCSAMGIGLGRETVEDAGKSLGYRVALALAWCVCTTWYSS
jgi:hypothetical protein